MTTYARLAGSIVAEITTVDPKVSFAPDLAAEFITVPDGTKSGWVKGPNGTFAAPQPPAVDLGVYANAKQWALATGGYTVTIAGAPLTFATDVVSQGLVTGKALRLGQPNAPATISWQFGEGQFVSIAAADFLTAAAEIADFVQATFDALKAVLAGVASGSITNTAQVDAAAWPSNVA